MTNRRLLCAVLALAAGLAAQGSMTVTTAKETVTLPWKDDGVFAEVLKGLSDRGGGTIAFSEGTFVFDRGVNIQGVRGITITGTPGRYGLEVQNPRGMGRIKTTSATKIADKTLVVDQPQHIVAGRRYQAYYPDQRGGRCVEMAVKAVVDPGVTPGKITLGFCNATHPGLTEIPRARGSSRRSTSSTDGCFPTSPCAASPSTAASIRRRS
jgi:hypothetical protein